MTTQSNESELMQDIRSLLEVTRIHPRAAILGLASAVEKLIFSIFMLVFRIEEGDKAINFARAIDYLYEKGLLENQSLETLHRVRMLGNACRHDFETPSSQEVYVLIGEVIRLQTEIPTFYIICDTCGRIYIQNGQEQLRNFPSEYRCHEGHSLVIRNADELWRLNLDKEVLEDYKRQYW